MDDGSFKHLKEQEERDTPCTVGLGWDDLADLDCCYPTKKEAEENKNNTIQMD